MPKVIKDQDTQVVTIDSFYKGYGNEIDCGLDENSKIFFWIKETERVVIRNLNHQDIEIKDVSITFNDNQSIVNYLKSNVLTYVNDLEEQGNTDFLAYYRLHKN